MTGLPPLVGKVDYDSMRLGYFVMNKETSGAMVNSRRGVHVARTGEAEL